MRGPFLLICSLLTACGDVDEDDDGGVTSGVIAELTETGGCSDIYVYAASADGDKLLWVSILGDVLADAYEAELDSVVFTATIPDDSTVAVGLDVGSNVAQVACNDVAENYELDERWTAVSGSVGVSATLSGEEPKPWSVPADAVITLTDVVLEHPTSGDQITIGTLEISSTVGWFPG